MQKLSVLARLRLEPTESEPACASPPEVLMLAARGKLRWRPRSRLLSDRPLCEMVTAPQIFSDERRARLTGGGIHGQFLADRRYKEYR